MRTFPCRQQKPLAHKHKLIYKKRKKRENRKRAEEIYLYLSYRTNTSLCTNSGKFWVAPG